MKSGYVGLKARRRRFQRSLLIISIFFIAFLFFIYFFSDEESNLNNVAIQENIETLNNLNKAEVEILNLKEQIDQKNQTIKLDLLKISTQNEKILDLENENLELINSMKNLEKQINSQNNLLEKKITEDKNNFSNQINLLKDENVSINNQIKSLKASNKNLQALNKKSISEINKLKKEIIEREKIILQLRDLKGKK
tara:strand:- start:483 stop:1070 length:588 start_codon:yes stop_codon:yes gene_type:complete